MNIESALGSEIFRWVIIPLFIFFARVLDVTLGTIRIVFVSRGLKYFAPLVGFFEVLIWLFAIKEVMHNLTNVMCYLAYGAGFAVGNLVGLIIEDRLALGVSLVRVITKKDASELITFLRSEGFGVTSMDAHGSEGKVNVIYLVVRRSDIQNVIENIRNFNPHAFYTIEDVRMISEGIFPMKKSRFSKVNIGLFHFFRKGK
jgi:uncharacterized protein YebE (UPF0316 family)